MEDTVSRSSVDSLSTGDEYVMVNAEPKLKIPDNGDIKDLEKKLSEVLCDENSTGSSNTTVGSAANTMSMGDRSNMVEIKVEGNTNETIPPKEMQKDHVINERVITHVPINETVVEEGESKFDDVQQKVGVEKTPAENSEDETGMCVLPCSFVQGDT